MAKYDGLLGQPILEVEEPDKEGGITFIIKDNRFLFIKAVDGKIDTVSIFPSTAFMNKNLLSLKIKVIPPSLSGSSTSRIICPKRPSYFAI